MPGLVQRQVRLTREEPCDPEVSGTAPTPAPAPAPSPTPAPAPAPGEDPLLTGYQDCAAEAVRFLVEEEGRAADDPTVVGLTEHLQARSAYLEYLSLLRHLETDMEDQLSKLLRSGPEQRLQQEQDQQEEALLSDQQRRLVESVFRGCDLVQQQQEEQLPPSPPQTPPPSPPAEHTDFSGQTDHPSRRHFQNNAYLDQVLNWAYTSSSEH